MIFAAIVWILHAPLLTLLGSVLVEDDGAHKVDAIVVLGGDAYGERIIRAAELAKSGYAPRVLVSGPANLLGDDTDQTIVYAARKGYPSSLFEAIHLPKEVSSTRSEVRFLGSLLKSEGVRSIDLVTSNYHTRRAAWLWRSENPEIQVYAVPAPDPHFSPETWFQDREGQKTFLLEWTKTFASRLGD